MPELWMEVWRRPGHATPGRVIDFLPAPNFGLHDGVNLLGDGSAAVASSFDRFDEIISIDTTTPANSVSSLIRVFASTDPATPIFEWLPRLMLPITSKTDRDVNITGLGIKQIWGYARVEAFDWDGSVEHVAIDPDWIYGGFDVFINGGLEDQPLGIINQGFEDGTRDPWWPGAVEGVSADASVQSVTVDTGVYALEVTPLLPEGGASTSLRIVPGEVYTVTARIRGAAGVDYQLGASGTSLIIPTAPATLVFAASGGQFAPGHENEAQLAFIGTGAFATQTLTFTAGPEQDRTQITVREGEAVLDGSDFHIDVVTIAGFGIGVNPWEATANTTDLEVSAVQASAGSYSLLVTAPTGDGTFETITGIRPGVTYTAGVDIGFASVASIWALEVRDVQGNMLGQVSATIGAAAFTSLTVTFTIPDFLPGSEGEVQLRVINYDAASRSAYVDEAFFYQGQAPNTIGAILGDLYDDATTDHPGRLVWEDEANPGNPYLTLDFTDAVDSAGDAWLHSELEVKLWMRMTYLIVMAQFVNTWGYEWRIVPDSVENGTWKLQVYNPGGMLTDFTAAASPAIQGGSSDVRRAINRILPAGSDYLVEGEARLTTRIREADLESALGLIEVSRLDRELPSQLAVTDAAFEDSVEAVVVGLFFIYTLTDPSELPLDAYELGDLLTVHDPPEVNLACRLVDVQVVASPAVTEYEVQFVSATAEGS